MNTFKQLLLSTMAIALTSVMSWGWGQKGHDVTAYIAEQHLTPTPRAAIDRALDGKSIVYWANWLDNASHTPQYAYTKTWHYKNINEGVAYEDMALNPKGDAVTAITTMIEQLSRHGDNTIDSVLDLKILVHVVGDIHQPMHMGHATDLGGNKVQVRFFDRGTNLHSIWDGSLVESAHKWSYTEWQQQLDRLTPQQQEAIIQGSIHDWAKESVAIADKIYKETPAGTKVSYNEIAAAAPIIEQQLVKGGLRLAHILNLIYDPSYAASHTSPNSIAEIEVI